MARVPLESSCADSNRARSANFLDLTIGRKVVLDLIGLREVWLKLINIPRRRHESIKKVRNFLDGLTESARVKVSVRCYAHS